MNYVKKKAKALSNILKRTIKSLKFKLFAKKFRNQKYSRIGELYPKKECELRSTWNFHSEQWTKVHNRGEDRRMLKIGRSLTKVDNEEATRNDVNLDEKGNLSVNTKVDGTDRWRYFYLNPGEHIWRNFEWSFKVKRKSSFRELQFGFRYRDFYNRYRYRHENNRMYFDKVLDGQFQNNISSREFKMELDREYEFKIFCFKNYFSLSIDGERFLDCYDPEKSFKEGSIAIILWEDDGKTPINLSISDQIVFEVTHNNESA